jgi:site-specific recombinase XerD
MVTSKSKPAILSPQGITNVRMDVCAQRSRGKDPATLAQSSAMPQMPIRSFSKTNEALIESFDRYLLARNYCSGTRLESEKFLKEFNSSLRGLSIAAADRQAVRSYLCECRLVGASGQALYKRRSALRSFYRFLTAGRIPNAAPANHIDVPKFTRKLPRVLSVREVEDLLAAADGIQDRAVMELFYASGLRLSELANLTIEQIDFPSLTLMVRGGKFNRDGLAFLNERCARALRIYIDNRTRGPVFIGVSRKRMSVAAISRIVKRTAARAGLVGVHPHSLRHAFATHLLNSGVDIRYVQELLRHKSVSSTQIYTHLAISDLQKAHHNSHPHGGK